MQTIPDNFRRGKDTFNLVLKGSRAMIYKRKVPPGIVYWEVFAFPIKPEVKIKDKIIPERQVYPKLNDFGLSAWCCMNYNRAYKIYCKLELV